MKPRSLFVAVIALPVLAYVALWRLWPVGYFNDDIGAILGAQSLTSLHYVHLETVEHQPLKDPPPGFSAVLAPFVYFVAPHWDVLKAVSMVATILSLFFFWTLTEGLMPLPLRAACTGLFGMNPFVASAAVVVLAEATLSALLLGMMVLWRRDRKEGWRTGLTTGICAGFATLVRPQAVLLLPAMMLAIARQRRWRQLAFFGLSALVWPAAFWIRNWVTPAADGYGDLWGPQLRQLAQHPDIVASQLSTVMHTAFLTTFCAWTPQHRWGLFIGGLVILGVLALFLLAWHDVERANDPGLNAVTTAVSLFGIGLVLLHTVWVAVTPRYFVVLVPWMLFLSGLAFERLRRTGYRWPFWLCAAVLALSYVRADRRLIQTAMNRSTRDDLTGDSATMEWIRGHTPAQARLLSNKNGAVFLFTGRYAYSAGTERSLDEFRHWLLTQGIDHILLKPEPLLNPDKQRLWQRTQDWVDSMPDWFPVVYVNKAEQTKVYAVVDAPLYQRAWQSYDVGIEALERGDRGLAKERLQQALTQYRRFPLALTALAVVDMQEGGSLAEPKALLEEALKIEPTLALAQHNRDVAKMWQEKKRANR